jgi:dipeptidyl aminopeptidase/acylaminoacyl peptidase
VRKHRLIDCNPRWAEDRRRIRFDCPEGHVDCEHLIPLTPALDGTPQTSSQALWDRHGDAFETLTIAPSIRRRPPYLSREAAIEDGCLPEYVTESLLCAAHFNIIDGQFVFAGDSR